MLYRKAAELGVISGLIGIGISIASYAGGVGLMTTWSFGITLLLVYLGVDIFLSLRIKKAAVEEISYGRALSAIMVFMMMGGVLTTIYTVILFHYIDPDLGQKMKDATIQNTAKFMEDMGAPQEKIDETIDKMKAEPADMNAAKIGKGVLFRLAYYLVFALIMAIFVRKQKPMFDNTALDSNISPS
jgi:hypothetical protein